MLYTHPLSQNMFSTLDLSFTNFLTILVFAAQPLLPILTLFRSKQSVVLIVSQFGRRAISSGTGHLEIGCSLISFQPSVKDLGVVLDSGLAMRDHISSVCRRTYLELRRIGSIRPFLSVQAAARSRIV